MQQARETEQYNVTLQKIPAGKRGFFYAGVFSDHPDLYGQKAGGRRAPGAGGGTARPAAGVCISAGTGRRLGCVVRGADALRAGADAGLWGGLLCRGGCRGSAGAAGAELRCADGGEHLPALRAGRGSSCAVALAGPVRPGGAGRLRHAGGERRLLRGGGGERRSAPAALRRGRPAGGGAGAGPPPLPARKAGDGQPAAGGCRGSRMGRGELRASPARGAGLCGGRAGPLLQGSAAGGTGPQRGDGSGAGVRRPFSCPCRRRAGLRVCRCGGACPGKAHRGACGLRRRLCGGGALRPASGRGIRLPAQRRGGRGALRPAACGLAGPCRQGR